MTDTIFADVSSYQVPVDDRYRHRFLIFRTGDGDYPDPNCGRNLAWSNRAVARHRMVGFGVYHVWRAEGDHGLGTLKAQVGQVHRPRMMVEWDIESWAGQIVGDHSAAIGQTVRLTRAWLTGLRPKWQQARLLRAWFVRRDRRRVRLYGNAGDLATIAPHRRPLPVDLADYSGNPAKPAHWAHQFTSQGLCPPFGYCDLNSADGLSPRQVARRLGFSTLIVRLAR